MRCHDVVRDVGAVLEGDTAADAARAMAAAGTSVIAVVDDDGRLVGAVRAADLAAALCSGDATPRTCVVHLLARDLPTTGGDDSVPTALARMLDHGCAELLCVDERGRYAGMVGLFDITTRRMPRSHLASAPLRARAPMSR